MAVGSITVGPENLDWGAVTIMKKPVIESPTLVLTLGEPSGKAKQLLKFIKEHPPSSLTFKE